MSKLSRNDLCPCGSGKKYKRCCLVVDEDPRTKALSLEDWAELNLLVEEKKESWLSPEPYMDLYPSVVFHGYAARKVGEELHRRPLPEKETFADFILGLFMITVLNEKWMNTQEKLPQEKKHVIKKWLEATNNWSLRDNENAAKYGSILRKKADGFALSMYTLSYDVYCLLQVDRLPDKLKNRLRNDREFQGVRYEIAIAAIFVRAGFEINFLDEKHGKKICEFVAHHPSGLRIAVEAKSRHRAGVLNVRGNPLSEVKADIKKLYASARKKKPKMPFAIFIDANLPATPEKPLKNPDWIGEILRTLKSFPEATPINPSPHNFLCITHFCPYYAGEGEPYDFRPLNIWTPSSVYPTTHLELWQRILEKTDQYGRIPREI